MDSRKILFLLRHPPYEGTLALETIDTILVAGVFDQTVSVLFRDDGVFQLLDGQTGRLLGGRSINKVLGALPEYGIERLFVCSRSLAERNLQAGELALPVTELDEAAQRELIADQHIVMND